MTTKTKSYYIKTYGCQANKSDSERIAGDYQARGLVEAKDWRNCDELVVNTCAVRQRAEDRARGFLYNVGVYFNQAGRNRPKIILSGCMLHHGSKKIYKMIPIVDQILPIDEIGFNSPSIRRDKKHAWILISQGCNSFCSYCIVPYSRGREKSRPMDEILTEVKELVDHGYNEITLLGQNVNSWGLEKVGVSLRKRLMSKADFKREDLPSNQSQYLKPKGTPPFVKLLQQVSKFDQIKIIRFLSANPWDFHDELIEEIGKNKKIDRYVHLAIQSGSNSVLARMNRGYTKENYLDLIKKLRQADPNIVLGTDIIVGFPGETDQEFQESVDLAKQINWHVGFVAQYSPRAGTASEKLYGDDISPQIKKKRWEILDQIINKDNLKIRPKVV
jgi:tRNA-2-methylthio-N6-dimethylallyladenosine synthase